MNVLIKSGNYELTDELRATIERKFGAMGKLFPNEGGSDVLEIMVGKVHDTRPGAESYTAEANLEVKGKLFNASAVAPNMEAALEMTRMELLREVQRSQGRARSMMRRAGGAMKFMLRGFQE